MNIDGLLQAIENAESIEEIKQAKIDYGYANIVGAVNKASNDKRNEINIKEAKQRKQTSISERKNLLKKNVGESIYYIGLPYQNLYKNRPCKLLKVNRTKCLVEFSGKDGQWNIPLMELHPEKTTAKQMIWTDKGIKVL